ncbi:hypothetical protein IQ13_3398 [Lacibacter cauensis]|uniref:Uncharacterized protein n=1 Tax=Lacibacter cauensis TaxID=510947 RepID=A0A562SCB6_9BACT|nr:hypothetical protein [Lacibacter cauensis]TWI79007.1 hypothetical protein IQ13_3398 [Lacibacter cauensis]
MKMIRKAFFSLLVIIAGATAASAQHSHKAPHGGTLQEAGGYHIEMVKAKDSLNFYVMNGENKVVSKVTNAKVEYEFINKTKSTATLSSCKNSSLCTSLPKANIFEFCTITFEVDGKSVSTKFKNTVTDAEKQHGHQH